MSVKGELSVLVSELTKSKPDRQVIKLMCEKTGFSYSSDLIQLMSDILLDKNNINTFPTNKKTKNQEQVGV